MSITTASRAMRVQLRLPLESAPSCGPWPGYGIPPTSDVGGRSHGVALLVSRILLLVVAVAFTPDGAASGAGQVVSQVADVPPETQVRMLRILLDDVFGTPEELRARFIAACQARSGAEATLTGSADQESTSGAPHPQGTSRSASRAATLAAFCAPAVRRGIEAALAGRAAKPR